MDFLLQKIEQILRYQKRWKKWQKVVASLACIVVFITTYALILPAITMDRDEAQSQGGIFWEDMQEAEETVASADAQGADQDGILSAEEANLIAGSELDVSEEQAEMDVVGEENSAGEGTLNPEAASERPAAIFDEVAGDVTVHVEAPEGAFPVGTTMKVEPVEDAQVMAAVQNAVEDPVTKVSAVDIIFLDASGNEIEPAAEIKVSMSSTVMENVEQPVIVHVDEKGVGETVESEQVDGAVVFESDRFSVYVMVETITTKYITAEGETYTITVTYGPEAEIPDGATLEVSELENVNKEYTSYVEQAAKALAEGEEIPFVNAARLFDISIIVDGKKIEPKVPVEVKIAYTYAENLNETSEVGTVHFKEGFLKDETEVMDVNIQGEDGKVDGVTFTAKSFSIYAVVIIDKEAGTFVFEDDDYKVIVSYTKESEIPVGTMLKVEEISSDNEVYGKYWKQTIDKLNEGKEDWESGDRMEPDPRKGLTDAAFFDISLMYEGVEFEPKVPLNVKIEYKKGGLIVPASEDMFVVHFTKDEVELIDEIEVTASEETVPEALPAGTIVDSVEYMQKSFSVVGPVSTGEYIENALVGSINIHALSPITLTKAAEIAASKKISDGDHDGVYDLTLSVTGASESSTTTKITKSNVVLVIDTSGSMGNVLSYERYYYSRDTYDPNTKYYGHNASGFFRVYRGSNGWINANGNKHDGYVYLVTTRMDATIAAANTLVEALLANNEDEEIDGVSKSDIVEISLVTFAGNSNNDTYGYLRTYDNQHFTKPDDLTGIISGLEPVGGTNWEKALQAAKASADTYSNQTGESTSVIFLTDGIPTLYGNDNGSGQEITYVLNPFGLISEITRSNVHNSWNAARDDARAIVKAGYTLYNIFTFGDDTDLVYDVPGQSDADYLRALTNYAYTTGNGTYTDNTLSTTNRDYFFNASNTETLQEAFQTIINRINNIFGYGGVTVDDGVTTGITNTSVTVDGTVNTNNFRYTIKNGNTPAVTVKIEGNTATFTSATSDETTTASGVSTTVNINGTNHTNTLFTATVDGVEYKITPATMDASGKVVWELAPVGIIENGRTYELTFEVWPNQLAYDMVADLNNGVKTLDQIRTDVIASKGEAVWNQIYNALVKPGDTYVNEDGETVTATSYVARTNYEQYVDYYTVDTTQEEGQEPVTTYTPQPRKELGPKDPVNLTSSKMDLIKHWEDSLDEAQLGEWLYEDYPANTVSNERKVKFHIWKADTLSELQNQISQYSEPDASGSYADADSHDYMDKTLGWDGSDYDWVDSLDVAPGTMIELEKARGMGINVDKHKQVSYSGTTYLVLESGHYYTVTEENIERHFELNTIVYHPMLVDGVLSNVTFKADGSVETIVPMSTVDATNTLKGGINVQKKVFDGEGHEVTEVIVSDDTFKVRITMNNADGTPYENWDYRIYYGQNNPNGTWSEANQNYGRTDHIYGSTGNGGIIETDLYIGDVIRVINVPAGVTYTVQETEYDNTVYTLGSNYTFPLTTGGTEKSFTTDRNGISYMISKGENDNFVADSDKKVVGNAVSQAVVVNKVPTARIKLLKVGDTTTPLGGVQFKIFYDEECTKPVTKDATGQAIPGMNSNGIITTDSEGYADLGTLAGTYYFQEVATKDGYNILTAPVRVTVEKGEDGEKVTAASTQEGVILNTPGWIAKGEDGIWVVKVNNSTGVELPMTGGPGTIIYTLSGIALMLGAALMYGFRMRRRERRLN